MATTESLLLRETEVTASVVVIGLESAGKSQLITSLTGKTVYVSNYRGSTVSCDIYRGDRFTFVDTPGLLVGSDTETTRLAVAEMEEAERLLLVIKATDIDFALRMLLPLAREKSMSVIVTFADKLGEDPARRLVEHELGSMLGVPVVAVDGRHLSQEQRERILSGLDRCHRPALDSWRRASQTPATPAPRSWLENRLVGVPVAILGLLMPMVFSVYVANSVASAVDPIIQAGSAGLVGAFDGAPDILRNLMAGRYGLITMGPLMLVWALPTVVLFAVMMGAYKASGLLDRLTVGIHPLARWFGFSGRDVVRVLMGFGCNVPAVISTRGCSRCSRDTCISAIAFGSACSYQLGATLAVFAATDRNYLVLPFMLYLTITTLIYVKVINFGRRGDRNALLLKSDGFLVIPSAAAVWRESRGAITHFLRRALPIFFLITLVVSVADTYSVWNAMSAVLGPVMSLLDLPVDAAVPVIMASVRKDGILLFGEPVLAGQLSAGQLLTGVYFAGVLLPCLVTLLTVMRERSSALGGVMVLRQVTAALIFSVILAWLVRLVGI